MLTRTLTPKVEAALARQAAVALIGPHQVGKTTLALEIGKTRPSLYLDLEAQADRDKLTDPVLYLNQHSDKLVILDEIHRMPNLFQALRGIIDRGRQDGQGTGRFLILGSADMGLLKQSGESLAGRITYLEMTPLGVNEVPTDEVPRGEVPRDKLTREGPNKRPEDDQPASIDERSSPLWLRGGFPQSLLAASDEDSLALRESFIRTYLERDVPQFGPRIPAETLRRLWTMLAHNQGTLLNASQLASSLSVSTTTVSRYIDLLVDLLLVRRLQPFYANVGKRLVKSPKTYIRDSGLLHALLNIETVDELLGHPVAGPSWEGFVIENLLSVSDRVQPCFYRTAAGAEIDLVLEFGGRKGTWAVEIKRSLNAKPKRGFYNALEDIKPKRAFVVHGGTDQFPLADDIEAIGLRALMDLIRESK